jgi:hypothetical protein
MTTILLIGSVLTTLGTLDDAQAPRSIDLAVRSGGHPRKATPCRLDLPVERLGTVAAKALGDRPERIMMRDLAGGAPFEAQAERLPGGTSVRITFVLPGETPANTERRFRLDLSTLSEARSPWTLSDPSVGALELKHGDQSVFRYNLAPVSNPNYPTIPARDAYLHPAYTPSGALITGDFSRAHPHHRGFFFAYTKTQIGDLHPDFWNIQGGTGKVVFDRLESAVAGPVTARIVAKHRWDAKGTGEVLREKWEIEAYDLPGTPFWMFDLTSTQQAVKDPIELPPYRYGGMAYRGPDPFLKGTLDVLTSEGLDRKGGDQKPARWVDLTGPVKEGSDRYGGAMILDHPSNPHHPTVARIHPTTLPFFAFTPSHDKALTIPADKPTVFRYRIVIHDGHPDGALDERLWRDFAEPPRVTLEAGQP